MTAAIQALTRFGLGRRAGEALPADPRGWLLDQLAPGPALQVSPLPDTPAALRAIQQERDARRNTMDDRSTALRATIRAMLQADQADMLGQAIDTDTPFHERLVWFWANHFTVSTRRGELHPLIGPYIREAIRPHVTGQFADMLLAVMRHPAMLIYLDNVSSAGPDSRAGQHRGAGLNENLARESLELHTVTPAAGYSQADVTSYAAILTGWSVDMKADQPGYAFRPNLHQPGPKSLLGRQFPEGEAGGIAALQFLATHPSTYQALAIALARHFIADDPPADAVARIATSLSSSNGDLGHAAAAMVAEPAAWRPLAKLRTPTEYVVAAMRALGPVQPDRAKLVGVLQGLGQGMWNAPLPNGWRDRAADWSDPETLLRRVDWAYAIGARAADQDPALVATCLDTLLRPQTEAAMQHAGSRAEAITLMLASPEFMRR